MKNNGQHADREVFFSLLMPTRNRAEYLAAGVGFFLRSAPENVELIVSDCSDTHSICQNVLRPYKGDPRLTVLDNTVENRRKLSSMVENWSFALDAARGRWITIIGDDDVCDPAVVRFLELLEGVAPQVKAVKWQTMHYDIDINRAREAKIPLGTRIMLAAGRDSVVKQAAWPDNKRPPKALCTAYHGAVRREILLNLKEERGTWFRFRTPDYDLGWSVALIVDQFALCERPFSITGVSPKSNSYSVRNESARVKYLQNWVVESRELDGWGLTNDPFFFTLPMAVLGFRNAFCSTYGINVAIDLNNFVSTLKNSLVNQEDDESFEQHKAACAQFLKTAFGHDFGISEVKRIIRPMEPMAGLVGDKLVAANNLFGGDITRFAEVAFGLVRPVNYLFGTNT